jgi:LmbE family N-acetylglucosaminyl deacetylase
VLALTIPPGPLRVLCIGAHPDDVEIGCGGTLLRLARRPGVSVEALVLTGTPARTAESEKALAGLAGAVATRFHDFPDGRLPSVWDDVKQTLEDRAREHREDGSTPDLVLAPRPDDAHQDHRLLGGLAPTVWRDSLVLHYEIPKWDGDVGRPTHYVALTAAEARRKIAVLNECFTSQLARDWWDDELFAGFMRVRGMECRTRYAEAFHAPKVAVDLGDDRGVATDDPPANHSAADHAAADHVGSGS